MDLVLAYLNRDQRRAVPKVPVPHSALPITMETDIYRIEAYALSISHSPNAREPVYELGAVRPIMHVSRPGGELRLEVIFPDNQNFNRFMSKIAMNASFELKTPTHRFPNCRIFSYQAKMNGPSEAMSVELQVFY